MMMYIKICSKQPIDAVCASAVLVALSPLKPDLQKASAISQHSISLILPYHLAGVL